MKSRISRREFIRVSGGSTAGVVLGQSALLSATPAEGGKKPNIVFIMTDQQSADIMSCCMGKKYINTPAMDGLAENGMLFTRAYTSNPLCMPARNSIFTGRYSHETGVSKNGPPPTDDKKLSPEFVSMGKYFRKAGYTTAYSGKWHLCLDEKNEKRHGFEILDAKSKLKPPADDNYDSRVSHAAAKFLEREQKNPFLLVVSFLNPHNICEWARRGAGRDQRLSCGEIGTPPALSQLPPVPENIEVPKDEPDGMLFIRRGYQVPDGKFPVGEFTPEDWRKQRWGYHRMVEKVDGEIGKVMSALHKTGQEENTLVIFVSDHGDCTGAHRFNQKTVFYDESIRIPFIVSMKGKTPTAKSDKLINTGIDILPTMMDCAGIEQPAVLSGSSVLPLAMGQKVKKWRDHVIGQNNMLQTGIVDGIKPTMEGRMVRSEQYKYCLYQYGIRREALYDMNNDPLETVNLAVQSKYKSVIQEHRSLLTKWAEKHHDSLVADLLANNVGPRPFIKTPPKQKKKK